MDLVQLRLTPEKHLELQNVLDDRVFMEKYKSVRDVIDRSYTEPEPWFLKLTAINSIMEESGIEFLVEDGKTIASYVNNGDTYKPTVLYDHENQEFLVTSWGDFYEGWQAENVIDIDCKQLAECIHGLSHDPLIPWEECVEGDRDEYDSEEDFLEDAYIDIRIQVMDDHQWYFRSGDSSYDQDHRGAWGYSSVGMKRSMDKCVAIAKDLIEQAAESADCNLNKTIRSYNND